MESTPFLREAYVAYMLRLWQASGSGGRPVWRASLENPHTGERLAFGDAQMLFAFLAELMVSDAEGSPKEAEPIGANDRVEQQGRRDQENSPF